jgi:hypothetical protein
MLSETPSLLNSRSSSYGEGPRSGRAAEKVMNSRRFIVRTQTQEPGGV